MTRAGREGVPATLAVRFLEAHGVAVVAHRYRYEEHGGTRVAARELGVDEHAVIKTLVMEDEERRPLVVLMHGDREVATGTLARSLGCKTIRPCAAETAARHSGYLVGGTSPFGMRKAMPAYMERSILELPRLYINGGARGLLLELEPAQVHKLLDATLVDAAMPAESPSKIPEHARFRGVVE